MRALAKLSMLCVVLLSAACGATRTPQTSAGLDDAVLRREEIQASSAGNMYDVIRMRRPRWLQAAQRGPTSLTRATAQVMVYLDGQRFGGTDMLQRLTLASVQWVEFLSASEAQVRFGHDNLAGVIHVHTRGEPR
jgi:hypothetical protein